MIKQHQATFIDDSLEVVLFENQYKLVSYNYDEGVGPEVFDYFLQQPMPPAHMLVLSDEMPF
jgi:hypothetical protein|tara:strand:- start:208 stop:393 length:186 start_codon:yes stop_codon:yes gene_type:complete